MSNNKYEKLANEIISLVGGKENIEVFTHCVTRLRFNVKDSQKVNSKSIEKLPGVLGCKWQSGQQQVIIGQNVSDVYTMICNTHNVSGSKEDNAAGEQTKKRVNPIMMLLDGISGSITPILPVLIGGGMIKIILLCCTLLGVLTPENATYITFSFVGNAAFYFLPVFVGATSAMKFGANMSLGMMLGAILIAPEFVALVSEGSGGSIFGIPIYAGNYGSSIFFNYRYNDDSRAC